MPASRRLLCVFAHPDDESFSAAGTAMKYAAAGARIVLSTATRGERGKCGDPPICSADDLPRVRASLAAVLPTYATFDFHGFATVSSLSYLLVGISAALLRAVHADAVGAPADPYAVR